MSPESLSWNWDKRYLRDKSEMQGARVLLSDHEMENVLPSQFSVTECKWCSLRTCYLPRFVLTCIKWSWGWGQGLCDCWKEPGQQSRSCFPALGTRCGESATAGVRRGQAGKIWCKIATKNCNQSGGRVWLCLCDFILLFFFCLSLPGQSWHISACCSLLSHVSNVPCSLWPPAYIMQRGLTNLTCFTTVWWVTWQYEEHNMVIGKSFLSSPYLQNRRIRTCGRAPC